MKKNKKGQLWLGEETLKLVLGVVAISFLVYLLVSLYFSVKDSRDLELAKESLNFMMSEINSGKEKVDIYNPQGWNLGIWPYTINVPPVPSYTIQAPKSCSNLGWESCICICKMSSSCDENGICLNNAKNFEIVGDNQIGGTIEIKDPPVTLNIDQTNKKISTTADFANGIAAGGGTGGGGGGAF